MHDLRVALDRHGVDTSAWGTNGYKSVDDLFSELREGKCLLASRKDGTLERQVRLLQAKIRAATINGMQCLKCEASRDNKAKTKLHDARDCARKVDFFADPEVELRMLLMMELGLSPTWQNQHLSVMVENRPPQDWPAHQNALPGLPTKFNFTVMWVTVKNTRASDVDGVLGLPEGKEFLTLVGDRAKTRFWSWVPVTLDSGDMRQEWLSAIHGIDDVSNSETSNICAENHVPPRSVSSPDIRRRRSKTSQAEDQEDTSAHISRTDSVRRRQLKINAGNLLPVDSWDVVATASEASDTEHVRSLRSSDQEDVGVPMRRRDSFWRRQLKVKARSRIAAAPNTPEAVDIVASASEASEVENVRSARSSDQEVAGSPMRRRDSFWRRQLKVKAGHRDATTPNSPEVVDTAAYGSEAREVEHERSLRSYPAPSFSVCRQRSSKVGMAAPIASGHCGPRSHSEDVVRKISSNAKVASVVFRGSASDKMAEFRSPTSRDNTDIQLPDGGASDSKRGSVELFSVLAPEIPSPEALPCTLAAATSLLLARSAHHADFAAKVQALMDEAIAIDAKTEANRQAEAARQAEQERTDLAIAVGDAMTGGRSGSLESSVTSVHRNSRKYRTASSSAEITPAESRMPALNKEIDDIQPADSPLPATTETIAESDGGMRIAGAGDNDPRAMSVRQSSRRTRAASFKARATSAEVCNSAPDKMTDDIHLTRERARSDNGCEPTDTPVRRTSRRSRASRLSTARPTEVDDMESDESNNTKSLLSFSRRSVRRNASAKNRLDRPASRHASAEIRSPWADREDQPCLLGRGGVASNDISVWWRSRKTSKDTPCMATSDYDMVRLCTDGLSMESADTHRSLGDANDGTEIPVQ
jgi:hypothetical protein